MTGPVALVFLALVIGAVAGLALARMLGGQLARRRLLEVHAARGEADRRARHVGALEARLQEQERAIRYLEEELDAKDLLSRGLKSGFDSLRDRLTAAERELAHRSEIAFQSQLESDDALAALWERVDFLTPLVGQLPAREARVRELEDALESQHRAHENILAGLRNEHSVAQEEAAAERERLREELAAAQTAAAEHERSAREMEAELREHRLKVRKLHREVEEHERQGLQLQLLAGEADRTASQLRQIEREHEEELGRRDEEVKRLASRLAELELVERKATEQEARIRELQVLECQLRELEALDRRLREREWKLAEQERDVPAGNGVASREAEELRRRLGELEPVVGRLAEREAEVRTLEAAVERMRDRAASQAAELDRRTLECIDLRARLVELQTTAASTNGDRAEEPAAAEPTEPAAPAAAAKDRVADPGRRRSKRRPPRAKRAATPRTSNGGRVAATNGHDDLKRIRGIGPAFERKLKRIGCRTFRDIAAWRTDDVERVAHELGASPEKIRGEWIRQAKRLAHTGKSG